MNAPTHVLYWLPVASLVKASGAGWWDLRTIGEWEAAGPLPREWTLSAPPCPDPAELAGWAKWVSGRLGCPVTLERSRARIRYLRPSWPFLRSCREPAWYVTPAPDPGPAFKHSAELTP